MEFTRRDALLELARRKEAANEAEGVIKDIMTELFDHQKAVVESLERLKAVLCTRRAGKTEIWARYMVIVALRTPGALARAWGTSRIRCKQLLWHKTVDVCARHGIEVELNLTELSIRFPNASEIRLVGASTNSEAEKKRGDKTSFEVVLECQQYGPSLMGLVEDIIEPSTLDTKGVICLEGTPGLVCSGYWYYITRDVFDLEVHSWDSTGKVVRFGSDTRKVGGGWAVFAWSLIDNPHLPHAEQEVQRIKASRNWADDNPTYLREYQRRWVEDKTLLFYRWSEAINTYDPRDITPHGKGWSHVLGWDIGFNDANALVVWGWHENDPTLYEVVSWTMAGVTGTTVVDKIFEIEKLYSLNLVARVADTGGAGKPLVEELQKRHPINFVAAKKSEKYAFVTLMNDDFVCNRIKTIPGSEYSQCVATLPKDPEWDPDSGQPPKEHSGFENHAADAGLYSWRFAWNYLAEMREPPPPLPGTEEFYDMVEDTPRKAFWEPLHEVDLLGDYDVN
jgi:hypothetical protein